MKTGELAAFLIFIGIPLVAVLWTIAIVFCVSVWGVMW